MKQPAFDFAQSGLPASADTDEDKPFRESMIALKNVYDEKTNLVCAGATGIDKGDLPKMFTPGSGRHMRYAAVLQIGRLGAREQRFAIVAPLARAFGFEVCEPKPAMTKDEYIAKLEAGYVALGPLALEMRDRMLGMPTSSLEARLEAAERRNRELEAQIAALKDSHR